MASSSLIIPLQADIVGLQGFYQIADTAQQIQQSNPELKITGYILTRHGGRSTQDLQCKAELVIVVHPALGL